MTRMEVHADLIVNHLEVVQVGAFGKLILAAFIDIVHQDVFVGVSQFEDARAFYRLFGLLLVVVRLLPDARCQVSGSCFFDAIAMSFGLVEKMIQTIFVDDIAINTSSARLRDKEWLEVAVDICKVIVGLGVIDAILTLVILNLPLTRVFA